MKVVSNKTYSIKIPLQIQKDERLQLLQNKTKTNIEIQLSALAFSIRFCVLMNAVRSFKYEPFIRRRYEQQVLEVSRRSSSTFAWYTQGECSSFIRMILAFRYLRGEMNPMMLESRTNSLFQLSLFGCKQKRALSHYMLLCRVVFEGRITPLFYLKSQPALTQF